MRGRGRGRSSMKCHLFLFFTLLGCCPHYGHDLILDQFNALLK